MGLALGMQIYPQENSAVMPQVLRGLSPISQGCDWDKVTLSSSQTRQSRASGENAHALTLASLYCK